MGDSGIIGTLEACRARTGCSRTEARLLILVSGSIPESVIHGFFPALDSVLRLEPSEQATLEEVWGTLIEYLPQISVPPSRVVWANPHELPAYSEALRQVFNAWNAKIINSVEVDAQSLLALRSAADYYHRHGCGYFYKKIEGLINPLPDTEIPQLYEGVDGTVFYTVFGGKAVEKYPESASLIRELRAPCNHERQSVIIRGLDNVGARKQAAVVELNLADWEPCVYIIDDKSPVDCLRSCEQLFPTMADLAVFLDSNPDYPMPAHCIGFSQADMEPLRKASESRVLRGRVAIAACHDYVPDTAGKHRIILHTSYHSTVVKHVVIGLAAAAESMGHAALVSMEKQPHELQSDESFCRDFLAFRPDVAIAIDHLRASNPIYPRTIRHVCWVQDDLPFLTDADNVKSIQRQDLVYLMSSDMLPKYLGAGYPVERTGLLPLSFDASAFTGDPNPDPEPHIVIISNLDPPEEPQYAPGLWAWAAKYNLCFPEISYDIPMMASLAVVDLRLRLPRAFRSGMERVLFLYQRDACLRSYAACFRDNNIPHKIFGRGWENTSCWLGVVKPQELPGIYRNHRAILHLGSVLLHQRVLEAWSSGGCVLSRDIPGTTERLRNGTYFADQDSLLSQLAALAAGGEWRTQRVMAAAREAREEHSHAVRLRKILADVDRANLHTD